MKSARELRADYIESGFIRFLAIDDGFTARQIVDVLERPDLWLDEFDAYMRRELGWPTRGTIEQRVASDPLLTETLNH
jgi:hypothetical protein